MEEKYWQEVPEAQYPVLRGQQKCDVAIVGGGLVGVTLAWMLTRQGVHTALVEAKTLGCGAASGCTGKVTAQLEETYERVLRAQGHEAAQLLCEMQSPLQFWKRTFLLATKVPYIPMSIPRCKKRG